MGVVQPLSGPPPHRRHGTLGTLRGAEGAAAAHGTPDEVRVRAGFRAPVLLPATVTYAAGDGRFELRGDGRLHLAGEVYPAAS